METAVGIFFAIAAFVGGLFGLSEEVVAYYVPKPEPKEVVVLFAGDMMFDRSLRVAMEEHGPDHILSCVKDELLKADLVVANLEGPITTARSVSVGSKVGSANNFTFTFPLYVAPMLYEHNIRVVNLGNNHILNFGSDGVRQTMAALDEAQVVHFGDPFEQSTADVDLLGVPLTFVNYNEFVDASTASTTIAQIRFARERGRMPIVYTHWGAEYVAAGAREKALAHRFVDAGAEMVIGSHPHVIQEHELYSGKHIYYSLGNFVFDQYWEDKVRKGLLITVVITEEGVQEVSERTTYLERDRRTCFAE